MWSKHRLAQTHGTQLVYMYTEYELVHQARSPLASGRWSRSNMKYFSPVTASTWLQPQHTSETAGSPFTTSGWYTFKIQFEPDTLKPSASTSNLSLSVNSPTPHCPCWFKPHTNTSPSSVIRKSRSLTLLHLKLTTSRSKSAWWLLLHDDIIIIAAPSAIKMTPSCTLGRRYCPACYQIMIPTYSLWLLATLQVIKCCKMECTLGSRLHVLQELSDKVTSEFIDHQYNGYTTCWYTCDCKRVITTSWHFPTLVTRKWRNWRVEEEWTWLTYMWRVFTSGGQELGCVFGAAVCKLQVRKCYIESLPLVPKDKRGCFSQSERSAVQLPLYCVFALRKQDA